VPDIFKLPATSSAALGVVVPMPTLPFSKAMLLAEKTIGVAIVSASFAVLVTKAPGMPTQSPGYIIRFSLLATRT
jgi:hypothetical protein